MANFSSFFPAAATGGGGFTKMNKYVTARSGDDATHKLSIDVSGKVGAAISGGGQTSFQWYSDDTDSDQQALVTVQDALVGYTFNIGYGTQTVTGNTGAGFGDNQTLSFTPAVAGGVPYNQVCDLTAPTTFTVNPANDLGLSDGDSLGFFMIGGGDYRGSSGTTGANGGRLIYGTRIISNASTNLVLTPGIGGSSSVTETESTISGGLTLTTADGIIQSGQKAISGTYSFTAGVGVLGYGVGGGTSSGGGSNSAAHGWGHGGAGGNANNLGSDGAILLYY